MTDKATSRPLRLSGDTATHKLTVIRALIDQLGAELDQPGEPDIATIRLIALVLDEELAEIA
jgi:hypothetical protein